MSDPVPPEADHTLHAAVLLVTLVLSAVGILMVVFSLQDGPDGLTWGGLGLCLAALVIKRLVVRKMRASPGDIKQD